MDLGPAFPGVLILAVLLLILALVGTWTAVGMFVGCLEVRRAIRRKP